MKILIADDEPLARERLRVLVSDIGPPWQVVAEAGDGKRTLERCLAGDIDLVLLDIRMPGTDGLAVANGLLDMDRPPAVIFTTAFSENALDAFDRQAVDYLLKPIRRERLEQALTKASGLSRVQLQALQEGSSDDLATDNLCVQYRGEMERIQLDEIIYFRAESKYVVVRRREGEVLSEESLKVLEQRFSGKFLRIHRKALINQNYLLGIHKDSEGVYFAELNYCDEQFEISRRHLPAVRKWLKQMA
jgi:two-component system response regulator AlgR